MEGCLLSLLVPLILGMALDSDSQGDVYDRAFMDVLLVLINVSVGSIGIMMILMALPCFRNSKRLMRCMKQDGKERNFKKKPTGRRSIAHATPKHNASARLLQSVAGNAVHLDVAQKNAEKHAQTRSQHTKRVDTRMATSSARLQKRIAMRNQGDEGLPSV